MVASMPVPGGATEWWWTLQALVGARCDVAALVQAWSKCPTLPSCNREGTFERTNEGDPQHRATLAGLTHLMGAHLNCDACSHGRWQGSVGANSARFCTAAEHVLPENPSHWYVALWSPPLDADAKCGMVAVSESGGRSQPTAWRGRLL